MRRLALGAKKRTRLTRDGGTRAATSGPCASTPFGALDPSRPLTLAATAQHSNLGAQSDGTSARRARVVQHQAAGSTSGEQTACCRDGRLASAGAVASPHRRRTLARKGELRVRSPHCPALEELEDSFLRRLLGERVDGEHLSFDSATCARATEGHATPRATSAHRVPDTVPTRFNPPRPGALR